MKTKKKSGKTLRKSGKSRGKIREFDGIKKVGTLTVEFEIKLLGIKCTFFLSQSSFLTFEPNLEEKLIYISLIQVLTLSGQVTAPNLLKRLDEEP